MNKIDEIVKEFYAQYGLTMHTFQFLERGLLELYALHKYIKDVKEKLPEPKVEYYRILSNPNRWTLGKIKDKLSGLKIFEESFINSLENANNNRIFFAHKFWWEREIKFNNDEGLVELHNEISSYLKLCNNLILIVDNMIMKIKTDNNLNIEEKMGLTDFKVREAYIKSLNKN